VGGHKSTSFFIHVAQQVTKRGDVQQVLPLFSQVYARPFSGGAGKWQLSTSGGSDPYWARDGKEVFYMNDNALN